MNKGRSFLIAFVIIFCASIIESAILANIYILPVIPDLVLICSIFFSVLNGKTYGELTGFTSGLTLDFITGAPLGLNCITRTVIGYVYGIFADKFVLSSILVPVISVATGTLLKHILIWIISFFYTAITPVNIISMKFLFELIFNTVLAPFIFKFLKFFIKSLAIHSLEGNEFDA